MWCRLRRLVDYALRANPPYIVVITIGRLEFVSIPKTKLLTWLFQSFARMGCFYKLDDEATKGEISSSEASSEVVFSADDIETSVDGVLKIP